MYGYIIAYRQEQLVQAVKELREQRTTAELAQRHRGHPIHVAA